MTCSRYDAVSPDARYLFATEESNDPYVPLFSMTDGEPIREDYPEDPFAVRIPLDPDMQGLLPGTFVGNSGGLLIIHREAVAAFEAELALGDHEVLPFTLVDHKGRDLSRDYVFFSPLGTADVLDPEASTFRRYDDGTVAEVTSVVLSAQKLAVAPDVFRLAEDPYEVFFREPALALIAARGFTNATLTPVEVR